MNPNFERSFECRSFKISKEQNSKGKKEPGLSFMLG
jgi:hypothetical protein